MTRFEELGLSADLLQSLADLKFEHATPVQEQAIPYILESENDLIAFAQTGTGKTAAFGLPVLEKTDPSVRHVQALVLSPTRELCLQIAKDLENLSKYSRGVKVCAVYGGASIDKQIREIKQGAQIIVGTPGRSLDLIKRNVLKVDELRWLVLDEADEMLSMGFKDELDAILAGTPQDKQTLLFSATMPREMMAIAKKYMHHPQEITVGKKNSGADNVEHHFYMVHAKDRYLVLKRLVDLNPDMYGIVFCRTRRETNEIAEKLIKDGYNADALHGDLSQVQRDVVMNKFRIKHLQLLVATDVAARGLDVNELTHVINFNLPDDPEVYVHRSGRTGRAGKSGISVSLIHLRERGKLSIVEKQVKKTFEQKQVPSGREICERQLFNLIDRMENIEVDESQIGDYLPAIYDKLEQMSREELIKKFVSMEFNQFLNYYKDAVDLNVKANRQAMRDAANGRGARGDSRSSRSRVRSRSNGNGEGGYSRLFLSLGKRDQISPKQIIGMINRLMPDHSVKIGQIDILKNFSFFEVDESFEREVIQALQKVKHKGNRIEVSLAKDKK